MALIWMPGKPKKIQALELGGGLRGGRSPGTGVFKFQCEAVADPKGHKPPRQSVPFSEQLLGMQHGHCNAAASDFKNP